MEACFHSASATSEGRGALASRKGRPFRTPVWTRSARGLVVCEVPPRGAALQSKRDLSVFFDLISNALFNIVCQ